MRAISAETGIPVGAVHRIKRQLEKGVAQGRKNAAAIAQQLPTSYVVKQDIGGVPHDDRRLTASVFERAVESAIRPGLLERSNRNNPWAVCVMPYSRPGGPCSKAGRNHNEGNCNGNRTQNSRHDTTSLTSKSSYLLREMND